jgi:LuxR family maltose regulon positive regulatory protein
MSTPVLVTKLYVPPVRPLVVPRARLLDQLNDGLHRKLTLVSAPAGFGKTTLVSEWVAASGHPVAWLSLDEADNDPSRFLTYLVAAIETVAANAGAGVAGMLQSPQPPVEPILTTLLNELATLPDRLILVLDDYHAIDSRPIDQAMTFLLDHLPPQLHLVITTREDPQLPLSRLRTRGQMTELRAADLRFTAAEAAAFLRQTMDLDLPAEDVEALEQRTEGWIAGLQLAALSMRGRDDVSGFIQAFAGDDRYIVDYLIEEVLARESETVRSFLLQTSVLDRLSGPLCDAVTGREDGARLLDTLERGNLFVVPLDDKRVWYRYHHLFADVLRTHALAEQPGAVATWHRRASEWYAANGFRADAIRHALAAEDFARAADLIEREVPDLLRGRLSAILLGWLRALPGDVIRQRPVLDVAYIGALMSGGELDAATNRLRDAERWLEIPAGEATYVNEAEFRRLPATIAMYRAGHAQLMGDVPATMRHARQVLDVALADDHVSRGAAGALLGLACWASGDLEAAYRHYAAGMSSLQRAGYEADVIYGAIVRANIRMAQGRLREAEHILEQAVRGAAELGELNVQGAADLYVELGEIRRERNDLDTAAQHLLQAREMAGPLDRCRWSVVMARLTAAQGDPDAALDQFDEAERLYQRGFSLNVRPIEALKARTWLSQGRVGDALGWVRAQGMSSEDDLSYLREFEHITLARVLLARGSTEEALRLLVRLRDAAEAGERIATVIEILLLQALAHGAQGDIPAALVPLERALTLAEPEGYVRIFVDEGPPMARLLSEARRHGLLPEYTRKLLTAFGQPAPSEPAAPAIAEPLSQRELEVLRLIAEGLSNREISERIYLALDTVKGHNRRIFAKLGVQRRTEALSRARDLGLL